MSNWYLYYRILHAVPDNGTMTRARIDLQEVLCDLRDKANLEWPDATPQQIQDFFDFLARNGPLLDEKHARYEVLAEPWATAGQEAPNV